MAEARDVGRIFLRKCNGKTKRGSSRRESGGGITCMWETKEEEGVVPLRKEEVWRKENEKRLKERTVARSASCSSAPKTLHNLF